MPQSKVDLPSLLMAIAFTFNLAICLADPFEVIPSEELGKLLFVTGGIFFIYTLSYLRGGFFGETDPNLDYLVTAGPYRICRHPIYLSFIIMLLGMDMIFRSVLGVLLTLTLSIPSAIYRARIEDRLLKKRFGKEWMEYAARVGFLFPIPRKRQSLTR